MQKIMLGVVVMVMLAIAGNLNTSTIKAEHPVNAAIEVLPPALHLPVSCEYKGVSTTPPWLNLNPPWDPSIGIPDVYNRNDEWLSMAIDATGRIYVCYQTINSAGLYGWGIATSTDQGSTWDNRVWGYAGTYNILQPDIAITDDGKIYIHGILNGGAYVRCPAFSRSVASCYNDPDSLYGVNFWNMPYRYAADNVTLGNGNQFVVAQFTVDRGVAYRDTLQFLFSHDSAAYYSLRFRPPGGTLGWSSIGANVLGGDTMLTHAVELVDSLNGDWNIYWYLDTIGIYSLWGMYTPNTFDDRYPSVYGTQQYTYLAFQSDDGTGNWEILFDFADTYGGNWDPTLQNISNDGSPDIFPRVHGFSTSVGLAWNHGYNQVLYDYSVYNGQSGTWTGVPEIVPDAATADTGYHCVGLLYTPAYYHCVWEDNRLFGTDSIDIFTSRRVTPVAIQEKPSAPAFALLKAFPNPFQKTVALSCGTLENLNRATLQIYDPAGRLIRTIAINTTRNFANAYWNGRDETGNEVDAGVYFCRLTANRISKTEKLIKLK